MRLLSKVSLLKANLKPPKSNQTLKRHLTLNDTKKCLLHFKELLRQNPSAIDSYSLLYVIKASYTHMQPKIMHVHVVKLGYESIIQLQTSLVGAYSALGAVGDARKMFDEMCERNVVCWTTLVKGYVDNGMCREGLEVFREMVKSGLEFDRVTVTVALTGCADIGALEMGKWIHDCVRRKKGFCGDRSLDNALINMYAKCGDMETARRVFDGVEDKDVTTWTSMIVGHALHGQVKEALELFGEMRGLSEENAGRSSLVLPNDVTFIGVLMACSHVGMVDEGKRYFRIMSEDYGLKPRESHFGCMVDLFCRAGLLKEAYEFIMDTPVKSNAVVWRTLLGACSLFGNIELGDEVRSRLLELDPDHVGDSVALSNIYAGKDMWDRKILVRNQIKQRRTPGCSSIETQIGITGFVAGNENPLLKFEV